MVIELNLSVMGVTTLLIHPIDQVNPNNISYERFAHVGNNRLFRDLFL